MQLRASLWTGLRALLLVFALGQTAEALPCRLALVLALDVSGSVDPVEYAQQVTGLAAALDHPEVRSLILDESDATVSIAVFEWSSRNHQYIIQPWISLDTSKALDGVITRVGSHRKVRAGLKTALGTALSFGAALLNEQSHCWAKTIDVSGDGENNIGLVPGHIYQTGAFDQITVNALIIGGSAEPSGDAANDHQLGLLTYYQDEVIHGTASFAMIARGYDDYADAMRRKLIRELQSQVLGLNDH